MGEVEVSWFWGSCSDGEEEEEEEGEEDGGEGYCILEEEEDGMGLFSVVPEEEEEEEGGYDGWDAVKQSLEEWEEMEGMGTCESYAG